MIITHNMQAMFTQNRLNITNKQKSKSAEKLSSGYRVNRAADDAAALQISEKMRWQVRGLHQASDNISDGISYTKVADGALNEVHAMLQRMNELCVQAANDTNDAIDREAIQKEIKQLQGATEAIFTDTKFNDFQVFTLDETNRVTTGGPQSGLLKVIESGNMTRGSNLANTVTFDNAANWVSSGNSDPLFTTTTTTYDSAGNQTGTNSTTANSKTVPALTHNGKTYNLQDNWSALLNAAPSSGTVTSNGITYTRNGNTLTYTNGNDTLKLNFSAYSGGNNGLNYVLNDATCTTFSNSGAKTSETSLKYVSKEGSGASFIEGISYPAAFIDFSGLGTNYPPTKLVGLGFTSTCCHGCGNYYSIKFVDSTAKFNGITGTTANGIPYNQTGNSSYLIELDISSIPNVPGAGATLVAAITDAVSKSSWFDAHWEQIAYNKNDPTKMYLYENTPNINSGKWSTWEPAPRTATGEKEEIPEEILHIQAGASAFEDIIIQKPLMSNAKLGITSLPVNSFAAAGNSISVVQNAINYVSEKRSYLGAMQNRLEYAKRIDNITEENTQAAESRIRDTDMAKEMVQYSMQNILQQAGQSMLAQANQSTQGVLSLLT